MKWDEYIIEEMYYVEEELDDEDYMERRGSNTDNDKDKTMDTMSKIFAIFLILLFFIFCFMFPWLFLLLVILYGGWQLFKYLADKGFRNSKT